MNIELVAYSMVHEYLLGRLPSAQTYDDRIIAQKVGYITKSLGIHYGKNVDFFWHKRGPYSRVLTSMLFKIENNKEEIIEDTKNLRIKGPILPKLDMIKSLIDNRPASCPEVFWLEILASLLFLMKDPSNLNKLNIDELLIKKKPFLELHRQSVLIAKNSLQNYV
ncbi:hypothetical protein [Cytobacillus gottheilii]|uniref:Uncharacterized protein n=1 Tax=Cytobacillus gottheilii TaxID=859144 RepID=A0ABX8F977_9BACI|nr:hypothetical protein [Cytobacillus gottheilii]QVY60914.1 hypothetical protein J1899_18365 [Cytobacillus gottheilii]